MTGSSISRRGVLAGLASALAVGGCSRLDALDAITPAGRYRAQVDIAYGPHPRHRLDVYVPDTARGPVPMVAFLYGGAWRRGNRGEFRFVAESLTRDGLAVAIPDYRLSPEVQFPGFVEDSGAAVAWLLANDRTFGADPGRVFVMGHSAGAYNGAMLALDSRFLTAAGTSPRSIAGFVGLSGPYDLQPGRSRRLREIFGPDEAWAATQPITHARAGGPPMLLLHGEADELVPARNSTALAAAVAARGGVARARTFPEIGHIGMITAFSTTLDSAPEARAAAVEFLRAA